MRKIFSILVVLGLVMGMVALTAPAAAQGPGDWAIVGASVTAGFRCELQLGQYVVTFTPTADLLGGVHTITVKFPAGTGYPDVWRSDGVTSHIMVGANPVLMGDMTRAGDEVTLVVPSTILAGTPTTVTFQSFTHMGDTTGIINPAAGRYRLQLKTSRAPNSTYVTSGWNNLTGVYGTYRINRTTSVYKYFLDFNPTYPGIAYDYIPPFKACGQDPTGAPYPFFSWEDTANGWWVTNFSLEFGYGGAADLGCAGCTYQKVIKLISAPAGGEAHFYLDGVLEHTFQMFPEEDQVFMWEGAVSMLPNDYFYFDAGLHFDTVGEYEISFEAVWTGAEACSGCQNVVRTETFTVLQWKDVAYIDLYDKWNLISLPLVPYDTDIAEVLAPLEAGWFALQSVWNFDACEEEWSSYPIGDPELTTLEAGKAYWVRMIKKQEFISFWTSSFGAAGAEALWTNTYGFGYDRFYGGPPWRLWLFGTFKPMPPSGPAAFEVCKGWNMVGYLGTTAAYSATSYLWNFVHAGPIYDYGFVYSWDASVGADAAYWVAQLPGAALLDPGLGYWISFNEAGFIYPP